MCRICYRKAATQDIDFINTVYTENIEALHGTARTPELWRKLLEDKKVQYYIIMYKEDLKWFNTGIIA